MANRGVSGDRLGEEETMTPRQSLEALLGALMHVEEPELKVQHRLTGNAKPKVAGLDNSCVHGSHGYLEHAFTGYGPERVKIPCHAWHDGVAREVLAKGPEPLGPIVMESDAHRVRMTFWHESEQVHDFTFKPVRHWIFRRDRGVRRCTRKYWGHDLEERP